MPNQNGTDDANKLSVTEQSGYSSHSTGPAQDTDVLSSQPEIHGDRPAHIQHKGRTRSAPPPADPMADLRRSAQTTVEREERKERNGLWATLAGVSLLVVLGVGGMAVLSFTGGEPEPVQQIEAEASAPEAAPQAPAPAAEPDSIRGVPIRKGLRGE